MFAIDEASSAEAIASPWQVSYEDESDWVQEDSVLVSP